ncbi:hypothetical protein J3F83DRAFT_738222 [Trichoderma novae-zelandiae]
MESVVVMATQPVLVAAELHVPPAWACRTWPVREVIPGNDFLVLLLRTLACACVCVCALRMEIGRRGDGRALLPRYKETDRSDGI